MMKVLCHSALVLCVVLALAGCGRRPSSVDAPEGATPNQYPRTYPDIATDPSPRP